MKTQSMIATVIIIIGAVVAGYYFYQMSPPEPTSSPSPSHTPTPTPVPGPGPRFEYKVTIGFNSSEGFNVTTLEDTNREYNPLFVLPQGGTGLIPVNISSTGDKNYNLSLSMGLAGETGVKFYDIRYTFTPLAVSLKAGEQEQSVLRIEVEDDAPFAYYETSVRAYTDKGGAGVGGLFLLITDYTPAIMYLLSLPTPGAPAPAPPGTPEGYSLTFEAEAGEEIRVMFLAKNVHEPLCLNFTAPPEISVEILTDTLNVMPRPESDRLYTLILTTSLQTYEGRHEIKVFGTTQSYSFERTFYLLIK